MCIIVGFGNEKCLRFNWEFVVTEFVITKFDCISVVVSPDPCFVDPITQIESCYLDQGSHDYESAKSLCETAGGYLVNILTEDEFEFIKTNFKNELWIGLTNDE